MNRSLLYLVIMAAAMLAVGCSGGQAVNDSNATANSNTNIAINTPGNGNAANAAAEKGEYPAGVAEQFLASCEESGGKPDFCTCMFEKVQSEYTFEEFSTIESKITAGEPPKDFVEFTRKARAECAK